MNWEDKLSGLISYFLFIFCYSQTAGDVPPGPLWGLG